METSGSAPGFGAEAGAAMDVGNSVIGHETMGGVATVDQSVEIHTPSDPIEVSPHLVDAINHIGASVLGNEATVQEVADLEELFTLPSYEAKESSSLFLVQASQPEEVGIFQTPTPEGQQQETITFGFIKSEVDLDLIPQPHAEVEADTKGLIELALGTSSNTAGQTDALPELRPEADEDSEELVALEELPIIEEEPFVPLFKVDEVLDEPQYQLEWVGPPTEMPPELEVELRGRFNRGQWQAEASSDDQILVDSSKERKEAGDTAFILSGVRAAIDVYAAKRPRPKVQQGTIAETLK